MNDVLESAQQRERVQIDSSVLLDGDAPRLIDEWQLLPTIWDNVRRKVDESDDLGIIILCGSTNVDRSKIFHSGAGRIGELKMRTMSLYEQGASTGKISLRDLFNGVERVSDHNDTSMRDVANLVVRGGWPGTIGTSDVATRKILRDYCNRISNGISDSFDKSGIDPRRMGALMQSLSRNIATPATKSSIRADMEACGHITSESTLDRYLCYLSDNHVIEDLPAWSPRLRSKTAIRTANVRHMTEPAIAATFMDATADDLMDDYQTFGLLFKSMVLRDIRCYAQANDGSVYHYRDESGLEADMIIHLSDGRWAAIEVKMGSPESMDYGAKNLLKLRSKVDESYRKKLSFMALIVATPLAYTRSDGIHVIPITSLRP